MRYDHFHTIPLCAAVRWSLMHQLELALCAFAITWPGPSSCPACCLALLVILQGSWGCELIAQPHDNSLSSFVDFVASSTSTVLLLHWAHGSMVQCHAYWMGGGLFLYSNRHVMLRGVHAVTSLRYRSRVT
jgi:hypothetical protein